MDYSSSHRTRPSGSLPSQHQLRSRGQGPTSEDAARRHRRNKSICLNYNPYERQASSLRAQTNVGQSSRRSPATSAVRPLQEVQEEPDFVIEERQAWSRRSPASNNHRTLRHSDVPFLLYDEEAVGRRDGHLAQAVKPFAPLHRAIDLQARPKTSRGLEEQRTLELVTNPHSAGSKFVEGSMTSRSQAVASTWESNLPDYHTSDSEIDDSEITPKATKSIRRSSVDNQHFGPALDNASPVRRTLFNRQSNDMKPTKNLPSEQKQKECKPKKDRKTKTGRKGLRKSLSSWSLHNIGEKIGLFSDASSSSDHDVEEQQQDCDTSRCELHTALDARKRKAEVAYGQQFSTKKQKDNSGSMVAGNESSSRNIKEDTCSHPADDSKVALDPNATIRARPVTRTRRRSLGPLIGSTFSQPESHAEHDVRKRPSRRELEKENQHLREMLRRSQTASNNLETPILVPSCLKSESLVSPSATHPLKVVNDLKIVPPLRRSSRRIPLQNMGNNHPFISSSAEKSNAEAIVAPSPEAVSRKRPPVDFSSPLGSLPHISLPDLPRTVGSITEEPEFEGDDIKGMGMTAKFTPSYTTRLRRRHSACSTDPQKNASRVAKENCSMSMSAAIPAFFVDQSPRESHTAQTDWQGWDDDVF